MGLSPAKRFTASPLSLAVSEGDFKQWTAEQTANRGLQAGTSGGSQPERQLSRLQRLTVDELSGPPRLWIDFWGMQSGLQNSFGLPSGMRAARTRLDENLAHYVANYLRLCFVVICCTLFERPLALVGLGVVLTVVDQFSHFTLATDLDRQGLRFQAINVVVTLLVWLVVFKSKLMSAASRAILVALAFVLSHAGLRLSPEEARERRRKRR